MVPVHVVLAWFSDRPVGAEATRLARERFDQEVSQLISDRHVRHDIGGDDWGLTVLHVPQKAAWPVVARRVDLTAVSLGIPIGLTTANDPISLGRRLLAGENIHADLVPPFGFLALHRARRLAIQQDWLGMCRLFTSRWEGRTVFCTRPSLLAAFLGRPLVPDYDGWASYAICGHFGGDSSPLRDVRLLRPGERVTGQRRDGSGWSLSFQARYTVDNVVSAGIRMRSAGLKHAMDRAARALTETASSVGNLYDDKITLGLSGGKDSRLIAASWIASGQLPSFITNEDMPAEGETARRLVEILHEKRALEPEHRLFQAGAPTPVLSLGLQDRVRRLQRAYDYQLPSTYTIRSPGSGRLPGRAQSVLLSGVGGELAAGSWYPKTGDLDEFDRSIARIAIKRKLLSAVDGPAVVEWVLAHEQARIDGILDHAMTLGLRGLELVDYVHLMERVRRWSTSAYTIGVVTPFLHPGFVSASFALSPDQKRYRVFHHGLLERFIPEWTKVPFVTAATSPSTATRVWEGDGLKAVSRLMDCAYGRLPRLLQSAGVEAALIACARGEGNLSHQKTLQQYAWLAVASQGLEPCGVMPTTSSTYERILSASRTARIPTQAPPPADSLIVPPQITAVASRVSFIKRTEPGRRVWAAMRTQVIQGRVKRAANSGTYTSP
jgi:hypothetical protein